MAGEEGEQGEGMRTSGWRSWVLRHKMLKRRARKEGGEVVGEDQKVVYFLRGGLG